MATIITVYGKLLLTAMGQTLLLALYGLFFACIIGMIVGIMSVLHNRICRAIAAVFVNVIRGVPMIVLAYLIYFGIPYLWNNIMGRGGMTLTALQAGTIAARIWRRSSGRALNPWIPARWRPPEALACPTGAPCSAWCCPRPSAR